MHTCEEILKLAELAFAQGELNEYIEYLADKLHEAQEDFAEMNERVQAQVDVVHRFIGCNLEIGALN